MPASKVDLGSVSLGEAAGRFLETKKPSTGTAYEKCLKRFVSYYGGGLERFIAEIEEGMAANEGQPLAQRIRPGEAAIIGFIRWHREHGYAPKSTRQAVAALQNALKYYGIAVSFDFIELPPDRPLEENEKHPWTLDEMRRFVEAAEYLRDKAFILSAFQSGLGIGDILEMDYGDVKREYEAGTLPLMIHKYRKKTGVELKTFLGRDAVHHLDMYLKTRPSLRAKSPLFTMLGSERRATKGAIQKMLREYAHRVDFILDEDMESGFNPARPHSLRSAFRSRLTGKMDNTLIEFFMGHQIGDQVKTYINMPDDELRELYANHEHLLAVEKTSLDERAGPSEVSEKALSELAQRVAELTRENAELRAEMESATDALRQEITELRPAGRRAETLEALLSLDPEVRRLVERLTEMIREAA